MERIDMDMESSEIADFFRDKTVLITGGAGFVGKACIEKLLRCCPDVRTIFVILRPKKAWSAVERLENLLQGSLFSRVRAESPKCISKVRAIHGDITEETVVVNPEEVPLLLSSVQIILHCAATIKFDLSLKEALKSNACGTRNVIRFARRMPHLEVLVHVSTAFSNCNSKVINESVYPTHIAPEHLIQLTEFLPEDLMKSITPQLLGGHPNTYCISKQMGEKIVEEQWREAKGIPICIVRPSIVIGTAGEEPIAGWVDNFNHLSGLLITAGMGIIRIFYTSFDSRVDVIPLDHVISLIVAAAWRTATRPNNELKVYNCCSGTDNPFVPRVTVPWAYEGFWKTPPQNVYWYPWQYSTKSFYSFKALDFIFHYIPAHLLDLTARLKGKQPRMVALYNRMQDQFESLQFFMNNTWDFQTDNTKALFASLRPGDQKRFNFNMLALDWKSYMHSYVRGMVKYVLKEKDEDLPKAVKNLKNKYILHQFVNLMLLLLLLWIAYLLISSIWFPI